MGGVVVEACHPKKLISPLLEPSGRFLWRLVSPSWSTPLSPRGREKKKKELDWTDLPETAGGVHGEAAVGPARRCEGWCRWCTEFAMGRGFLGSLWYQQKLGFGRGNGGKLSMLCAWVILDRYRQIQRVLRSGRRSSEHFDVDEMLIRQPVRALNTC